VKQKVKYLIIGQGLSGSFLAFHLLRRKRSFLIIDQGHNGSSSAVAAGMINPVALRRLIPTWRAEEFMSYNANYYQEIESLLGNSYYFDLPLDKLIGSSTEKDFWDKKLPSSALEKLMDNAPLVENKSALIKAETIGRVSSCKRLSIHKLLCDFRSYLIQENLLKDESISYSQLDANSYGDIEFEQLIFCEGSGIVNNPFFNYLPYSMNKGEVLSIKSNSLNSQHVLKKKVFVMPTGEGNYKVGATYAWSWENLKPEEKQKEVLLEGLQEITNAEYSVTNHEASLRPSTKDRRPFLGSHPEHSNYFIFNGMGSRGCLIAPLLGKELLDHIEMGSELNPEADIQRFTN